MRTLWIVVALLVASALPATLVAQQTATSGAAAPPPIKRARSGAAPAKALAVYVVEKGKPLATPAD